MTNPASSTLATESGVKLVPDLHVQLELESDLGVENEILGQRPLEQGSEP